MKSPHPPGDPSRGTVWWHLALLLAVSTGYEALFIHYGINRLDESWPLYAGMQLLAGGTLYDDVLWVFPPAHVWAGTLAYALAPPGIVLAREIYAAFSVALCVGIYFLGRRLTTPPFALLAALLVAVAAPRGHLYQLLFGYRYLVLCVLALLAFERRLRTGDARWLLASGVLTGVAVVFRLTPAFAVSCGIGLATLATSDGARGCLRDWSRFAVGLLIPVVPVLAWFATTVGLAQLWHEVLVHPLAMLQPLPLPEINAPQWSNRQSLYEWFVAVQFRAIWLLYAGFAAALLVDWIRARRRGEPFRHALLLAVVVWGAVFFIRSLGRSDEPHLDSVIPPVCLLVATLLGRLFEPLAAGWDPRTRTAAVFSLSASVVAAWVFLLGTDLYWKTEGRGVHPLYSLGAQTALTQPEKAAAIDQVVSLIERYSDPDDRILNLAPTPLFYVLTGRRGPGKADIVMPGTFLSESEERDFLSGLQRDPPAVVVWPSRAFDDMPERSVERTAPLVSSWVRAHYRPVGPRSRWIVMIPRARTP